MAGLQQLRKRLKSIRATGQLAEAMRTAATIKYSRVSKVREEFTPYAGGSADMLSLLGRFGICREADRISPKNCLVLFGSNRGLCGGFNAELFRFMDRGARRRGRNAAHHFVQPQGERISSRAFARL